MQKGRLRGKIPAVPGLRQKHIDETVYEDLREEVLAIGKMLGSFMGYLQRIDLRGSKFHEHDEVYRECSGIN